MTDTGREGIVCRINVSSRSDSIRDFRPAGRIEIGARDTGFATTRTASPGPSSPRPPGRTSSRASSSAATRPTCRTSPPRPRGRCGSTSSTQAFVNVIDGVNSGNQTDGSDGKFLNLHLGARTPEAGKKKLFFANPWAIAFTTQRGNGTAYVVSAGCDLLVKLNVDAATGR